MKSLTSKVILLGDQGVGKTSIRKKYMGYGFKEDYTTTLGVDMSVKKVEFPAEDSTIDFQIWDFAGQTAFIGLHKRNIRNAEGVLIVFDLTDVKTRKNLSYWTELLNETGNLHDEAVIVFLGNKHDLVQEEVDIEELRSYISGILQVYDQFDESTQVQLLLTSAKTGENIEHAFNVVGRALLELAEESD